MILALNPNPVELGLGIALAVVAVAFLGLLFGVPVVQRIKLCKKEYGKDWRKHF